jgi:hypothetical protein
MALEAAEQSRDKGHAPPLYQDSLTLSGIFVVFRKFRYFIELHLHKAARSTKI